MHKLTIHFLLLALLFMATACQNGQKPQEAQEQTEDTGAMRIEVSEADRQAVNDSLAVFLGLMREHQFDKAVAMLWVWDGEFVSRLSPEAARKQAMIYRQLPGIDYKLESVMFNSETDNTAKYCVVLFEKEEGDNSPNTIFFGLNPIRREGKWYLTVSDAFAEKD
jgi:hypothetical protein